MGHEHRRVVRGVGVEAVHKGHAEAVVDGGSCVDGELGRIKIVLELHCHLLYRTFAHYSIGPNSGTGSGDGSGHSAMWDEQAFLSFCDECDVTLVPSLAPPPESDPTSTAAQGAEGAESMARSSGVDRHAVLTMAILTMCRSYCLSYLLCRRRRRQPSPL